MTHQTVEQAPPTIGRLRSLVLSESRRAVATIVVSAIVVVAYFFIELPDDVAIQFGLRSTGIWVAMSVAHGTLTLAAFSRLSPAGLKRAVQLEDDRSRAIKGVGASWSVQVSLLALIVVGVATLVPAFRESPVLLGMALLMVVASFYDVVAVYAASYARVDLYGSAFRFPGTEPRTFTDYVYLAITVQTTLGVGDVRTTEPTARKLVTQHSVLAFIYSTFLVGMVVSLLLGIS